MLDLHRLVTNVYVKTKVENYDWCLGKGGAHPPENQGDVKISLEGYVALRMAFVVVGLL